MFEYCAQVEDDPFVLRFITYYELLALAFVDEEQNKTANFSHGRTFVTALHSYGPRTEMSDNFFSASTIIEKYLFGFFFLYKSHY